MEHFYGQTSGPPLPEIGLKENGGNPETSVSKGQPDVPWRGQEVVLGKGQVPKQKHSPDSEDHWPPLILGYGGFCRSERPYRLRLTLNC